MNQQTELFPNESPKKTDLVTEMKYEVTAIEEAADFARTTLGLHLLFPGDSPISVEKLIEILTNKFGYGVRLYLFDIAEILFEDDDYVGDFARNHLTAEVLQDVLRGKDEKQKQKDESTLDELFARTLEMRSSEKFKEVVEFVACLREYSPFNNMLVKLQRPTARYYATASHWKRRFKREVKPEAIPIVILRPMGPVMLVYDVEDTTGKPLPPQIENPFAVEGIFNTDSYYQTVSNCRKIGIEIEEANLAKSHAGSAIRQATDSEVKLIVRLNRNHDVKLQYATLCHELAHLFLGHLGGDPYGREWNSRIGLTLTQRELEAEAVSYILCVRAGLASNSAEYLSAYLENPEDIKKISVEAVMKTVAYVEQMSFKAFRPRRPKNKESASNNL